MKQSKKIVGLLVAGLFSSTGFASKEKACEVNYLIGNPGQWEIKLDGQPRGAWTDATEMVNQFRNMRRGACTKNVHESQELPNCRFEGNGNGVNMIIYDDKSFTDTEIPFYGANWQMEINQLISIGFCRLPKVESKEVPCEVRSRNGQTVVLQNDSYASEEFEFMRLTSRNQKISDATANFFKNIKSRVCGGSEITRCKEVRKDIWDSLEEKPKDYDIGSWTTEVLNVAKMEMCRPKIKVCSVKHNKKKDVYQVKTNAGNFTAYSDAFVDLKKELVKAEFCEPASGEGMHNFNFSRPAPQLQPQPQVKVVYQTKYIERPAPKPQPVRRATANRAQINACGRLDYGDSVNDCVRIAANKGIAPGIISSCISSTRYDDEALTCMRTAGGG